MRTFNFKKASYIGICFGLLLAMVFALTSSAQETAPTDSTTVNVTANQTTIVVVPTPEPHEPADAVVFYITDDREVATAGDIVTYRVVARNQRNTDINEVRISVLIPDYLVPVATSPEAEANPQARTLTWNNVNLSARAEQTYAVRAQIAPETPPGYSLRTVAEINGPGVRGSFTDTTVVESKQVIVSEEAATTVASLPTPTSRPPYSPPVPPTAKTGPTSGILLALFSLVSSAGIAGMTRLYRS